jgi:hypothetical protein
MVALTSFLYNSTDDPTSKNAQYLTAIVDCGRFDLVKKLMGELPLETILSTPVHLEIDFGYAEKKPAKNKASYLTILDAFGLHCGSYSKVPYENLFINLKSRMGLPTLFPFLLGAHYHEYTCSKSCVIVDLLDAGANANTSSYRLTPLQIVVRNWDYAGVEILLERGADPNGVGQLDGYIPVHFDTTWAQASPLHILRNAEYGFMVLEHRTNLKVCFTMSTLYFGLLSYTSSATEAQWHLYTQSNLESLKHAHNKSGRLLFHATRSC